MVVHKLSQSGVDRLHLSQRPSDDDASAVWRRDFARRTTHWGRGLLVVQLVHRVVMATEQELVVMETACLRHGGFGGRRTSLQNPTNKTTNFTMMPPKTTKNPAAYIYIYTFCIYIFYYMKDDESVP